MFCIYCGATVEKGVKACPHCGSEILVLEPPKTLTPENLVTKDTISISLFHEDEKRESDGRDIYSSAPHRFREEPEMENISSGRQMEPLRDEYNIAGNAHDPQNVPYTDAYEYETYDNSEENAPKKKRVWPIVLAIVLVVVLLLGAGVGYLVWYLSPVQRFDRAVEASNYTQIIELLPEVESGERDTAVPKMNNYAAETVRRYNSGEIKYNEAEKLIERLMQLLPETQELKALENELEVLKASKDAFTSALTAETNDDKAEALRLLQLVAETDANYSTAQEHISAIRSEYRSDVIKEADALAAKKDFEAAYTILQESSAILGEDAEIQAKLAELTGAEKENYVVTLLDTAQELAKERDFIGAVQVLETAETDDVRIGEQIESYKNQYREEFLTQAEVYAEVSNYEEAVLTLESAKNFLGEDEILNQKIKEYTEKLPGLLVDMQNSGGMNCAHASAVTGVDGSTYASGLKFVLYPETDETVETAYEADSKYKRFSGTWIVESGTTNGFTGKIRVYVDGSLRYELTSLTVNSKPTEMNLLINGAEEVHIEVEGAFAGLEETGCIYLAGAVFRN